MNIQAITGLSLATLALSVIGGCSDSENRDNNVPNIANTGRIIDSPIEGLTYDTVTQLKKKTNLRGEFGYGAGEQITFSIGAIKFPQVPGQALVSPFTMAGTDDISNQRVINIARLLQTIDEDGVPDNGIKISDNAESAAETPLNFNQPVADFAADTAVTSFVSNAGGKLTTLIAEADAIAHLGSFLGINSTWSNSSESLILFTHNQVSSFIATTVSGLEYGTYVHDSANKTISFTVSFDNNGSSGLNTGAVATINSVSEASLNLAVNGRILNYNRQTVSSEGFVDSWLNTGTGQDVNILVLLSDNRFIYAEGSGTDPNGLETGGYTLSNGLLSMTVNVDTSAEGGLFTAGKTTFAATPTLLAGSHSVQEEFSTIVIPLDQNILLLKENGQDNELSFTRM